jgi:DNA invertase Pin-like site-specific DNA recombinase
MDPKEREQINHKQNNWLLKNFDNLKAKKQETKEPISRKGKKTRVLSVIETARLLYDSGKTHKEIALLLGVSISTAGRFVRKKEHERRKY